MNYINLLNIFRQDKIIRNKIKKNIHKCITKSHFINSNNVKVFEKNFKLFFSSKYCVSCANGSDALFLALKSFNLPKRSEVIIPAMTYVATANAVINSGLIPKIAEVNKSGILDISKIKKSYSNKTKAIIIVNLYGQKTITNEIIYFCKKKKIKIIEDSAQSHGCYDCENCKEFRSKFCCLKKIYKAKKSDAICYSFFPGKNLGCYGDGGAILINKRKYFEKIMKLKNNGSIDKLNYTYPGINSRLDGIQAEILNIKLNKLKVNNKRRNQIAKFYYRQIKNPKIELMFQKKGSVYHQFLIFTKNRNKLKKFLHENKIESGMHYAYTIDSLKSFRKFKDKNLKNLYSKKIAKNSLSIPIDPFLTKLELDHIVKILNKY